MAALRVQLPEPSSHTASPGLASTASAVESTTNLAVGLGLGAETTMNLPVSPGVGVSVGAGVGVGDVSGLVAASPDGVPAGVMVAVGVGAVPLDVGVAVGVGAVPLGVAVAPPEQPLIMTDRVSNIVG